MREFFGFAARAQAVQDGIFYKGLEQHRRDFGVVLVDARCHFKTVLKGGAQGFEGAVFFQGLIQPGGFKIRFLFIAFDLPFKYPDIESKKVERAVIRRHWSRIRRHFGKKRSSLHS